MASSSTETDNVDSIYYRDGASTSVAMHVLRAARMQMFNMFMKEMAPDATARIIDIGVSDDENDGANFLEKHYPWPQNITCAGIGDGEAVVEAYPAVQFQRIEPGKRLPFPDDSFDIACSNAVIEHVGGPDQRKAFIAEHLRIAKSVFITFPNRWFPVEHHTGLPLVHYSSRLFRRMLAGSKYDYWVDPVNMDFLSRKTIAREWPDQNRKPTKIVTAGLPLGPFSSNVAIILRDFQR